MKTVTLTIDENGDQVFLKGRADIFKDIGTVKTQRASHVEPDNAVLRLVFHVVRSLVSDASHIAAWTRTWGCVWRVNTAPLGGPILKWSDVHNWNSCDCPEGVATWYDREQAIEAEIRYVNTFLFTRRTQ